MHYPKTVMKPAHPLALLPLLPTLAALLLTLTAPPAPAADDRAVDPSFYRTSSLTAPAAPTPLTTPACQVQPIFAADSPRTAAIRALARFARITVQPNGACNPHAYPAEEQSWFILSGQGTLNGRPLRPEDFLYIPVNERIELAATSGPLVLLQFGYRVPPTRTGGKQIEIANANDVKKQVVGNHPPSTLYQLLIGDTRSTRDRIAAGATLTSLFIMDFALTGTNFPHHHDREEELYVILDGTGDMVAGPGTNGVEGRFPAQAGDAYFLRLNTTVGFYNTSQAKARILAARWLYPFPQPRN